MEQAFVGGGGGDGTLHLEGAFVDESTGEAGCRRVAFFTSLEKCKVQGGMDEESQKSADRSSTPFTARYDAFQNFTLTR